MREFKFRAWDKIKKRMSRTLTIEQIEETAQEAWPWFEGLDMEFYFKDLEWIQFTGLYDKNKKEIWEGDIVRFFYPDSNTEYVRTVVFENGAFIPVYGHVDKRYAEIEVLGNIYENMGSKSMGQKGAFGFSRLKAKNPAVAVKTVPSDTQPEEVREIEEKPLKQGIWQSIKDRLSWKS